MKIESIKKTGSKYKILLDSGQVINTYEEVILNNGLLFHKYVSSNLLEKINEDTNYYKSYNKALDMINRRLRSEKEIEEYLRKSKVEENDIKEIVQNLKRIGLIDDKLFAKAYTNDKVNLSTDGPHKIRKYLENNNIKEEYINDAINSIDKEIINQKIDKIITKKINANTKYTPYLLKQKILTYLINLGYSREDITNRLENIKIETRDTTKEMEKIYDKLNKKYKDKELIYKLKSKLYTKGYTKEEIENFITKK